MYPTAIKDETVLRCFILNIKTKLAKAEINNSINLERSVSVYTSFIFFGFFLDYIC